MRKAAAGLVMVLMFVLFSTAPGLAGKGVGPGDGTGPIHDILSGTPFNFTGTVVSMIAGEGVEIATEEGNVKIYGIGPYRYWKQVGIDRPAVGDAIQVTGYTVVYNGIERNIAMSLSLDGQTVELRSPETGDPIWKGVQNKKQGRAGRR